LTATLLDLVVERLGSDFEIGGRSFALTIVFDAAHMRELVDAPLLSEDSFLFGECLVGFFEFLLLPVRRLGDLDLAAPGGIGLASEMKDGARANAAWW